MTALPHDRIQASRSRILEAALELFMQRGYFNTTIQDLSSLSGVSVGSIYHHFGSKTGVARALYQGLMGELETAIDDIAARAVSSTDQCRAAMAYLLEFAEQRPRAMQFIIEARHQEFLPDEPPMCSAQPFVRLRELVRRGIERGEVRDIDVNVAATTLFGGALRLIAMRLDGVLETPLPEHFDDLWTCAWRGVAAP